MSRYFYLVPKGRVRWKQGEPLHRFLVRLLRERRHQRPVGGVKVIYQHCGILCDHGIEAFAVHVGGRFQVDWFPHSVPVLSEAQALRLVRPGDVLVCPEIVPERAVAFPCRRRVLFIQGLQAARLGLQRVPSYRDAGLTEVLVCSRFLGEFAVRHSDLPCVRVRNGIDLGFFRPEPLARVPGSVFYLGRKDVLEARAAIALLPASVRETSEFVELQHSCSQQEMVRHYQAADVVMPVSRTEGFGLPPLEAMACGCAVVGYTGGGGDEFMHDGGTALVAADGDTQGLARQLSRVLTDPAVRERVRAGGAAIAQEYGLDGMAEDLMAWVGRLAETEPGHE
jgi:glycosyltransferase involved in cell wall biosynthesis